MKTDANNSGTAPEHDKIDVIDVMIQKTMNPLFDLSKPSPSEVCGFYPRMEMTLFITPNIFI